MVDITYIKHLQRSVTLDELRGQAKLKGMILLQKGSRLSVQPVTPLEWQHILNLEKTGA